MTVITNDGWWRNTPVTGNMSVMLHYAPLKQEEVCTQCQHGNLCTYQPERTTPGSDTMVGTYINKRDYQPE
jgi:hypothetical protein